MIARLLAVGAASLVLAAPAAAACTQPRTSMAFMEGQVMCPTCHTTLDMSDSQAARQIEDFIRQKIAACWTAQRIEAVLVQNYGKGILAAPPDSGFDILAWWLPIAGVLGGGILLAFGVWRWSRGREDDEPPGAAGPRLDDETERKIDELLAGME
ncbi:MAG: cytochrome c-type biogenesis protein [Gaiellaceae bacterium]